MNIKNIDYNDKSFVESFINFCVSSKALRETECGSMNARRLQAKSYLKQLQSSDISISCESEDKKHKFYCFFDRNEDDKKLYLSFAFPDCEFFSWVITLKLFYLCCLSAMDSSNLKIIDSEIRRRNKKVKMVSTIKRIAKALDIRQGENGGLDRAITSKKKITNELKKLQIKSNRNE